MASAYYRAIQNKDLDSLKRMAEISATSMIQLPLFGQLEYLVAIHARYFTGESEKIKRDLAKQTNSSDVKAHINHITDVMIAQIPDELSGESDNGDVEKWHIGQILRMFQNPPRETFTPAIPTHPGSPSLQ